jgi:hypothetical protein
LTLELFNVSFAAIKDKLEPPNQNKKISHPENVESFTLPDFLKNTKRVTGLVEQSMSNNFPSQFLPTPKF